MPDGTRHDVISLARVLVCVWDGDEDIHLIQEDRQEEVIPCGLNECTRSCSEKLVYGSLERWKMRDSSHTDVAASLTNGSRAVMSTVQMGDDRREEMREERGDKRRGANPCAISARQRRNAKHNSIFPLTTTFPF